MLEYLELAHMHKGEVIGIEKEKFVLTRLWLRRDRTLRFRVQYLTLEWRGSVELTELKQGCIWSLAAASDHLAQRGCSNKELTRL